MVHIDIDIDACPNHVTVAIRRGRDATGTAAFAGCPLRPQCTNAAGGRTIRLGANEAALARARTRQTEPGWQADYRATRPKVERKLAHLMRRRHGGRTARVRGRPRSTPTSTSSPPPPTWPVSPCSDCAPHPPDGR